MLELPNVTMVCVDCSKTIHKSFNAMYNSREMPEFWYRNSILLTDEETYKNENAYYIGNYYDVKFIPKIKSKEEYSYFMIKELNKHFTTDFVLVVQWDGWVVNPYAWTDEFLKYDYIGAPWYWLRNKALRSDGKDYFGNIVGNGGFSLRSKKLQRILQQDMRINQYHPEDGQICTVFNKMLEDEYGIRFAPEELASRFSVENCEEYNGQFGHHTNQKFMKEIK